MTSTGNSAPPVAAVAAEAEAGAGRGGGAAGAAQPPSIRQRLGGLLNGLTISGATSGSFAPPTQQQRQTLADLKTEVAAIEKQLKGS